MWARLDGRARRPRSAHERDGTGAACCGARWEAAPPGSGRAPNVGLAGSLARQQPVPASAGTLPTHKTLFIGMVVGVTLIVVALTYLPALALGPLAEAL